MKSIQKRLIGFFALLIGSVLLLLWLSVRAFPERAVAVAGVSVVLLFFFFKQWKRLRDAKLILDNRILAVPSAVIVNGQNRQEMVAEETVVSTFGILVGSEVFRWGCDGMHGVRLSAVGIDRSHITLNFGRENKTMCVKLLHGLINEQAVAEVKRQLWHETGVEAEIHDW